MDHACVTPIGVPGAVASSAVTSADARWRLTPYRASVVGISFLLAGPPLASSGARAVRSLPLPRPLRPTMLTSMRGCLPSGWTAATVASELLEEII